MSYRSVLFTPATRPERVEKAWTTGAADVVVADLEDAVALSEKDAARDAVRTLLASVAAKGCRRGVRINAWPSEMAMADLDALSDHWPDVIVVPKVEDPEDVASLHTELADLDAPEDLELVLILETAAGVLNAWPIAAASDRVGAVALGAEDLAADVGITRTPSNLEVHVPRAMVPIGAAAAGVAAIDMITADYQDMERTAAEMAEAMHLGYVGKMCIHPAQAEVVHATLRPSQEDLDWANRVAQAAEAAGADKGGIVVVDGKMIDIPLIKQARRILARA